MASLTSIVAGGVGAALRLLPHDYAVKAARKIRRAIEHYDRETGGIETDLGIIRAGGVRRSIGEIRAGRFEAELFRWARLCMRPGDTVWDVGANVGLYSIYFAKIDGVRVLSIEPNAASCLELARNIIDNDVSEKVTPICAALSATTGFLAMPVASFEAGYNTTTAREFATDEATGPLLGSHRVPGFRGDDLAALFDAAPDHIKIDVDGAEIDVLRGATGVLPRCSSLLVEAIGPIEAMFDREIRPLLAAAGLQEAAVAKPNSGRNRIFVNPSRLPDLPAAL